MIPTVYLRANLAGTQMTVATAAMLAGHQTFPDMAAWARRHKYDLIKWLKPKRKQVPSASTIRRTIIGMDVTLLEDVTLHAIVYQSFAANMHHWVAAKVIH